MTNAHVVDGADEVIVTLTDKREFKAKIIGTDRRTDVAVVKIEATALPTVKIGDVNQVKVGAWVVAIGSPFNLENTVTAGIVSAKQRDTGEFLPLFQTDVAINPGNSGGPLINMRGEVIGINSQIYSRSGGYMGISFAIPIDEAIRVSDQLRASGRVIRGPHRRDDRPGDEGRGRVDRPWQARRSARPRRRERWSGREGWRRGW
jgi:serine protease Do